ncbi:MAG: hypothetical protein LBR70_00180 [Lactobacillaceae bacterium]|jgi:hypothetical protein|nr:hypothetical protein [Lactobacillaceae bacterium]
MTKNKKIIAAAVSVFIIAIVILGIFLMKPNKSSLAKLELENLVSSIRNSYKNSPGYWGLDTKYVINNGLARDAADGKIVNIYGKTTLAGYDFAATTLMPGSKTFDIIYEGLTKEECISLSSIELSDEQKLSLISVFIKSGDIVSEFGWGEENKLPISVNIAKRFCKNNNDILWRFE